MRAELVSSEAPRLLSEFLSCADRAGWPGAEDIHDLPKLTSAQRRKAVENQSIRAAYGWNWGVKPQGWRQTQLERRTRPDMPSTPVVARGWNLNRQHDLGERAPSSALDSYGSREYGQVYLLTDGLQVALKSANGGRWIAARLSGSPNEIIGADLIAVLRALANAVGVSLDISGELSDALSDGDVFPFSGGTAVERRSEF